MRGLIGYGFVMALFVGIFATVDAQKLTGDPQDRMLVRDAWHVFAFDDDIDTAFELVADLNTYAQLAKDKVELVWGGTEDVARVKVEGIKPDSTRVIYTVRANGTTPVTTSDSLMFFERAWIDSSNGSATNALTIRDASGDVAITQLIAGQYHSYAAHRFSAKRESNYIKNWSVQVPTNTGTIEAELRIYQDWADVGDLGDEYTVVDAVLLPAGPALPYQQTFDSPVLIPQYGVAVIVCKGGANNADVNVKMSGYTTR